MHISLNWRRFYCFTLAFMLHSPLLLSQKQNFISNANRKDYYPFVKYFSEKYDISFGFSIIPQRLVLWSPCKVFAKKGKRYFKIDCELAFTTDTTSFTSIKINHIKECSISEGATFMDSLLDHHIFSLPPQPYNTQCLTYDSITKTRIENYAPSHGGQYLFQVFDKSVYRRDLYQAIGFLVETCPSQWSVTALGLINLFKEKW